MPKGPVHPKRIAAILEEPNSDLPTLVCKECQDLLEQIAEKTTRIEAETQKARTLSLGTDSAWRHQTMPGVGPQTALAIRGFAPPMDSFKRGRNLAAWLGLVPRQYSSSGKERLGRVSKAGHPASESADGIDRPQCNAINGRRKDAASLFLGCRPGKPTRDAACDRLASAAL